METLMKKNPQLSDGDKLIFHQLDARNIELVVVHPLFDVPEKKADVENAGPLHITKATWFALFTLRVYLIVMILLAAYRFMVLAGILKGN